MTRVLGLKVTPRHAYVESTMFITSGSEALLLMLTYSDTAMAIENLIA